MEAPPTSGKDQSGVEGPDSYTTVALPVYSSTCPAGLGGHVWATQSYIAIDHEEQFKSKLGLLWVKDSRQGTSFDTIECRTSNSIFEGFPALWGSPLFGAGRISGGESTDWQSKGQLCSAWHATSQSVEHQPDLNSLSNVTMSGMETEVGAVATTGPSYKPGDVLAKVQKKE